VNKDIIFVIHKYAKIIANYHKSQEIHGYCDLILGFVSMPNSLIHARNCCESQEINGCFEVWKTNGLNL
jgi:hypothetical protein